MRRQGKGRRLAQCSAREGGGEGFAPGVEHGDQANVCTEMLGIGRHGAQGISGGAHEEVVHHRLVLECDLSQQGGQREDDVEIGHRQQLGLAGLQPFGTRQVLALRTVPVATGVVGDALLAAVAALLKMAAQGRSPACRDG